MHRYVFMCLACIVMMQVAHAQQEKLQVRIGYLTQQEDSLAPLSLLDVEFEDNGVPGAHLATKENATTGQFTNQEFSLEEVIVDEEGDVVAEFARLAQSGLSLFVVDLPADKLLQVADSEAAQGMLLFSVRAQDDRLRQDDCRANVLHVAPSRAMLADALAQYLVWKRWNEWFLMVGKYPQDIAFADAVKRSSKRFGGKIIGEQQWTFDAGARRTDSGHVTAQQEVPAATQVDDYDVMIVADEGDEFGEYLPYRTFRARPVAGTQGLTPTAWHRSHEQWGGTQLQRRFEKLSGRDMSPRDYAAWAAVRSIGEATTQIKSAEASAVKAFLFSDKFKLAAFKGVPLTYRDWNGQLRQPVLIVGPRMLVTVSPQKEFLHEYSPLDTLGYDRPESTCKAF